MSSAEGIREGLLFVKEHELTRKEVNVLLQILNEPKTNQGIADGLGSPKSTIHHIIMRLKLKGLIDIHERDEKGTNIYKVVL